MTRFVLTTWLVLSGLSFAIANDVTAPLTDEDITQLIQELRPDESALWRTVPWQLSLMDAQAMAAERRQPLFIWAMDGHPLGCT